MDPVIRHLYIDLSGRSASSPYIFGHNLEHTRACVSGGLSAEMLRNRKFAGRPQARKGVSAEWYAVGEKAFFCNDTDPYVRHYKENGMWRRNERDAQTVQNPIAGQPAGIGQRGICLQEGKRYIAAVVARCDRPVTLDIALLDGSGQTLALSALPLDGTGWKRHETVLTAAGSDRAGQIIFTFREQAEVIFGAVSLLPEDHFHGMRSDVVSLMKDMGIGMLRWPGGNFAGEYRWQDMFLPVDERAPLQAYMEDETQPYTHGYDMHQIDTDDFIALCREIGAEPFITVNLAWDTPEECAAWVEYCNGSSDSRYGSLRAKRGHMEPYSVRYWSLGNEMGHGHMEGPMTPERYASLCRPAAEAMLAVSPELRICNSGPFTAHRHPKEWIEGSAKVLAPVSEYLSYHTYNPVRYDFTGPEGIRKTYEAVVSSAFENEKELLAQRAVMPDNIHISYDEWNLWAEWFRSSNAMQGIYTACMLHMLLKNSAKVDMPIACYFQPVGEGAIDIFPDGSEYAANGQVFSLLKVHKGAALCRVEGAEGYEAAASVSGGTLSVTLVNADYENGINFCLDLPLEPIETRLLSASDLLPGSHMEVSSPVLAREGNKTRVDMPPRSIALLRFRLPEGETK